MKTFKNLFEKTVSFENLYLAYRKAKKRKRYKPKCQKFELNLENNLVKLQKSLSKLTWKPGEYYSFAIYEKKNRIISAAPFEDRVVHHAICNVIEPIFEKSFIFDSYANRKGKGSIKALKRAKNFFHQNKYILKCDIRKYFPSINHNKLKEILRKKIADKKLLILIDRIIDKKGNWEKYQTGFSKNELVGIPIGNLTSQLFANIYLNYFDHFIKELLKSKFYIRYVDDFILFSNEKKYLIFCRNEIENYLNENLYLELHKKKRNIFPIKQGLNFLGYRIVKNRTNIRKENYYRFIKRDKKRRKQLKDNKITIEQYKSSVMSFIGYIKWSNAYPLLIKALFSK